MMQDTFNQDGVPDGGGAAREPTAVPIAMLAGVIGQVAGAVQPGVGGGPPTATSTTPWPDDHEPAGDVEREMWRAFDAIRRKPGARLSLSAVARLSKHSRTMISHDGGDFPVLRRAILDEIGRRRTPTAPEPTPAEREARKEERRQSSVKHWRAVAREADGRNAEYLVQIGAASATSSRLTAVLRRILADMKAGRWVRADPSSVLLGEIEVLLGSPAKAVEEVVDGAVE